MTEFRAAVIVGSGSLSFELIRCRRFECNDVDTSWSDAASSSLGDGAIEGSMVEEEGLIRERRQLRTSADAPTVIRVITSLGGENGWLHADTLWKMRGILDLVLGGIGPRTSRRSCRAVREGDTTDFWRVEAVEPAGCVRR